MEEWLFAGTLEGAATSAMLYSLVETAKANKLEPYAYLRYIFEKLALAATLEDYEGLLCPGIYPGTTGLTGSGRMCLIWRL